MNRIFSFFVVVVIMSLSVVAQSDEIPVYTNDFQGVVGSEWSSAVTDITPIGSRQFLGQFWNDSVYLALANLPQHTSVTVSFDLFVIRTWDGSVDADPNFPGYFIGPDVWNLSVVGGPTLLNTTFNNHDFYNWPQAFPDNYPGANNPARTGAVENNTLGYTWGDYGVMDSVYHPVVTFTHSSSSLDLVFSASLLDWWPPITINNESWGLDNVKVSVQAVPEPATLLGFGLPILMVGLAKLRGLRKFV